jgi:protoporphyrinogen oxidase
MVGRLRLAGHHVHLGCAVKGFEFADSDRITAIVTDQGSHTTDCVISGVQLPDLADLLPDQQAAYRSSLRTIDFLGNVCLVLILDRPLSHFYWTNVTDPTFPFVGIIEQTRWARPSEFAHRHLVYLSAYVPPDDARLRMDADALMDLYLPYVRRMFPDFSASTVVDRVCWATRYAQPIVKTGYRHLMPAIRSSVPNLFVCTMAQIYPSDRQVSNGVEMARRTIDVALPYLGSRGAA